MSGTPFRPSAAQARALDLSGHVFVAAGPGSGKTATLVERFLAGADAVGSARAVLALTFTEKAAGELRGRLARAVTDGLARADREGDETAVARWSARRDEVAEATIATIHGFAAQVLRDHALDAGLDPAFRVLEGADALRLCDQVIDERLDAWSDRPGALREHVERLADEWGRYRLAAGLRERLLDRRRSLLWLAGIEAETPAGLVERWHDRYGFAGEAETVALLRRLPLASLRDEARRAQARLGNPAVIETCAAWAAFADEASAAVAGAASANVVLTRHRRLLFTDRGAPRQSARLGDRRRDWTSRGLDRDPVERAIDACLGEIAAAFPEERRAGLGHGALATCALSFARLLADALRAHQAARARAGALDFDDLVEHTARLLADDPGVRAALRARYRHVLVDEFQDTDPLQWSIVRRLVDTEPGGADQRLFLVGDKKQSIYAFRGADVTVFDEAAAWVGGAGTHPLAECRRTLPVLVTALNALFARILAPAEGTYTPWEAEPQALEAARPAPAGGPAGELTLLIAPLPDGDTPAPALVSGDEPDGGAAPGSDGAAPLADAIAEADLIARHLLRLEAEGCGGALAGQVVRDGAPVPFRFGDAALLLRRRRNLKLYEDALRRHGIPFTVAGGVGFYSAEEITDVVNLLRFLADPRDVVALAGWLRSPMANVSDDALTVLAAQRGSLLARLDAVLDAVPDRVSSGEPAALLPEEDVPTVMRAAALARSLRARAERIPPGELIHEALDWSGAWVAYAGGLRGPQALANLRKILDVARHFDTAGDGTGTLRRLVERLEILAERDEAAGEAATATDPSLGVTLCTVHAAKGLEWPVVIVPELEAQIAGDRARLRVEEARDARGGRHIELAFKVAAPDGDGEIVPGLYRHLHVEGQRRAQAEEKRIFYVACTRARDRLILSTSVRLDDGHIVSRPGSRLEWVARALGLEAVPFAELAAAPERTFEVGDAKVTARIVTPALDAPLFATASAAAVAPAGPEAAPEQDAGEASLPAPPARVVLRPSHLGLFSVCPLKLHYAEWMGLAESDLARPRRAHGARRGASAKDRAALRGTIVHRVLELGLSPEDTGVAGGRGGPRRPGPFDASVRALAREAGASEDLHAEIVAAAARAARSCLGPGGLLAGLASADAERLPEVPFSLLLAGGAAVVQGAIDLLILPRDGDPLVVDYKSDVEVAGEEAARELAEHAGYARQIEIYAIAAATLARPSCQAVETALIFTERGLVVRRRHDRAGLERARAELEAIAATAAAMVLGERPAPADAPCSDCAYAHARICPVGAARLSAPDTAEV